MPDIASNGSSSKRRYIAWSTATLVGSLAILAGSGWIWGSRGMAKVPPAPVLKVEPPVLDLGDEGFAEGSLVRGEFRLVNTSTSPLTVRALNTSCSCLASVVDGGKSLPFVIEPSASAGVMLTTTAASIQGLRQSYTVAIDAGPDGAAARDYQATMSFNVIDSIKADPPAVRLYEAPTDALPRGSITLYTYHNSRNVSEPTVRVLDTDRIQAKVTKLATVTDYDSRRMPRYAVEVSFLPAGRPEDIAGTIAIATPGEPSITVPCSCSFQRDQTIEPDRLDVPGKAGQVVERRLFQQFRRQDWREPSVVERPAGSSIEVSRFDDRTNLISIKVTVPDDDDPRRRDGDRIVLASRSGDRKLSIPVHYRREE